MIKHTKGPWRIGTYGKHDFAELERDCKPGATLKIASLILFRTPEINEANAHLIVSAPELLEVCKEIVKEWENPLNNANPEGFVNRLAEKIHTARRVIEKAEGEV